MVRLLAIGFLSLVDGCFPGSGEGELECGGVSGRIHSSENIIKVGYGNGYRIYVVIMTGEKLSSI